MSQAIKYMNDRAIRNPKSYGRMSGGDVEELSFKSMREVAPCLSIDPKRIDLVSGHSFPDIILDNTVYGVEIKSTQKDSWTSTGSSIVESTRCSGIERIYMLFGKLGGQPEFRCKPYQRCLSSIAVTHSPRYLIDMQLGEKQTIFAKMNTDYEEFRHLPENEKISYVRKYYLQQAKLRGNENLSQNEMPWWMGQQTGVDWSFYNDLSSFAKEAMMPRLFALFPTLFDSDSDKRFKPVAIWLCDRYSMICYNMRDSFTAGGTVKSYNGKKLDRCYPAIVGRLIKYIDEIKVLLSNPDAELLTDIQDFWDFNYDRENLLESWVKALEAEFSKNKDLSFINLRELLDVGTVEVSV
ncbi:hypothetical protein SAMN05216383_11362 [Prevotella sp. KH2C16]|nr:hypothetical protein SAMN05216383_11362 [Prevotella sp. KH2C16]